MDLGRITWRNAAVMLGLKVERPFVRDPAYEYDAPQWCDLAASEAAASSSELHGSFAEEQEAAADAWFAMPHPLQEPKEPTPPAEPLFDLSTMSPYKSPSSNATLSKVTPGPSRRTAGAFGSAQRVAGTSASASARKGRRQLASPIAIHPALHSTPLKNSRALAAAAAAGISLAATAAPGTPMALSTPHRLLPTSAGKPRLVLGTPLSANKLASGAVRVAHAATGSIAHKMQFDAIDETTPVASPERGLKSRAQRVSMAYVPAAAAAAPSAASSVVVPPIPAALILAAAAHPVTSKAPTVVAAGPKSSRARSTKTAAAASTTTVAGRKRRSADANPPAAAEPMLELDAELEALLASHNAAVTQEQQEDAELAAVIEQHNQQLLQQSQPAATSARPATAGAAGSKGVRKQPAIVQQTAAPFGGVPVPGSGSKQPRKKARMVSLQGGGRSSAENSPPSTMAASMSRVAAKPAAAASSSSFAASMSKTSSASSLTARSKSHRSSTSASSTSQSGRLHSPGTNPLSPAASSHHRHSRHSAASTSTTPGAALHRSMELVDSPAQASSSSPNASPSAAADISFHVEDLLTEEERSAVSSSSPAVGSRPASKPAAARKSMGKALRQQAHTASVDDELNSLIELDDQQPSHAAAALVTATPAAAAPPRRMAAAVSFTAAAAPAKPASRPATAHAPAGSRKPLAPSRSGANGQSTAAALASSAGAPVKKSATTTGVRPGSSKVAPSAATSRKPAAAATTAVVPRSRAATSLSLTAEAASSLLSEDDELAALLAAHNSQFAPKPAYVARQHSAAQLKAWEASHGRKWHDLTNSERDVANMQMAAAKIA